jgi:hypothetical protein
MNTLPKFVNTIQGGAYELSTAASAETIYTGQAEGSVIEMLIATSTDTAAIRYVNLTLVDTATDSFSLGLIPIAAGAGTINTAAAAINLLNNTDMPFLPVNVFAKPILNIPAGWKLEAEVDALTALKAVTIVAGIRDY